MTEEDNKRLDEYGITYEAGVTYSFAGYKYQRMEDAVSFAKKNQHLLSASAVDDKVTP